MERYPADFTGAFPTIHQLEAVNLVVAVKTLLPTNPTGFEVVVHTDNSASVATLSSGRGSDPVLLACARELWLEAAKRSFVITIIHKAGVLLELADALSRAHLSSDA